ncbi:MAG TPA: GNAT family N-acetyltransferase [Nocardioidaceae bacterium]|nr:GNAT family N-acetyltransferase [Nocardioidaceae bacterium]
MGQRVVVRRVLPGQTGPTGGPAMTDLLGVMESWTAEQTTVRAEDGAVTAIALRDIVSGKPVPPRPSTRLRVPAGKAERIANAGWPAVHAEPLGDWLLRAADGFSTRANSALVLGDPGRPLRDALDRVRAFYGALGLPTRAQVVVGSDEHGALERAGWVSARPGEADTSFQLGSVSRALRAARALLPGRPGVPPVTTTGITTTAWLADDARARAHPEAARTVLEGPPRVAFAAVPDQAGFVLAKGRAAAAAPGSPGEDWVGITDVWVHPEHRRRGLAQVVLTALLEWAAEGGATTAYLQVRGDNPAALALYERMGFVAHHDYRYLTPAGSHSSG